jgi:hypothetical protein
MDEITERVIAFNKGIDLYNQTVLDFREIISRLANGLSTLKTAIPDLEASGKGFLELRNKYKGLQLYYPNELDPEDGQWLGEIGKYLLDSCAMFGFFVITLQAFIDNSPTMDFAKKVEMGTA